VNDDDWSSSEAAKATRSSLGGCFWVAICGLFAVAMVAYVAVALSRLL